MVAIARVIPAIQVISAEAIHAWSVIKLTPRQYKVGYQVAAANIQIAILAHGLLLTTATAVKKEPATSSIESLSQNPSNDSRGQSVGWNHSADEGTVNRTHHQRAVATP